MPSRYPLRRVDLDIVIGASGNDDDVQDIRHHFQAQKEIVVYHIPDETRRFHVHIGILRRLLDSFEGFKMRLQMKVK